jgi:hypothetical protein
MHHKITGKALPHEPASLRGLWKWLKELGHTFNIIQKWKKMFMEALGLNSSYEKDEISIDDVLQKAIVELHSK